jgi:hypothetical protein
MDNRYLEIVEILCKKINYDTVSKIIKELYFLENSIKCHICERKVLREDMIDTEYLCSEKCNFCGICINPFTNCKYC